MSALSARAVAIERLRGLLGYPADDLGRLPEALTHKSYANETGEPGDNERLEFLGDAIVGLVVAEALMARHPGATEGQLSRWRAGIVNARSLATFARARGLGEALRVGRGEELTGGRNKETLLADAYEAVVGALYRDQGLEAARGFVLEDALPRVEEADVAQARPDAKTALQELVHARWRTSPSYTLLETTGPDHEKLFTVQVEVGDAVTTRGVGRSKKLAERDAAQAALEALSPDPSADESAPSAAGSESPSRPYPPADS